MDSAPAEETEPAQQAHGEDAPSGAAGDGPGATPPPGAAGDDAVWTYRGYQLRPGDFTTAMVHLFRAEITRANTWRQRLDATTNWAVITTGAAISFAFGSHRSMDHGVIILNTLLVTLFLYIEARRYRYYELWSSRVRLMETDFFAAMLVPPFRPRSDWAESLAENLLTPRFPISMWEAFGRRLRRNYMWIYLLLAAAWVLKIWIHPSTARTWQQFADRAAVGTVPGEVVLAMGLVYNIVLLAVGLFTAGLKQASGEVLPRYTLFPTPDILGTAGARGSVMRDQLGKIQSWYRPGGQRKQLLTYVVTDRAEAVSQRILREMGRGVTALRGTGMYTGRRHSVLLSALTVTEVAQFETLVRAEDPEAFVIVTPVQEVRGSGFSPLSEEEDATGPRP